MPEDPVDSFIDREREALISLRRDLHRHPELGWTEYRTTHRIAEELAPLDFELHVGRDALESTARMGLPDAGELAQNETRAREAGVPEERLQQMSGGHTGLVARWDTGRPGPHVALRFDIDALPIREADEDDHPPAAEGFRSEREGVMHACGHDGHAAIGVGVARFLREHSRELGGRFTLLFQPSEEGVRGARSMVERGWLDDADYFLCGHLGTSLEEVGAVAATTSGFLSSTNVEVWFRGRSAHAGGAPQEGKNALLAAANAALNLHAIPRHGDGATRVNVGQLEAGTARNIVPDRAYLGFQTRGATSELNEYMQREARRIVEAAARMYDVAYESEVVGEGIGVECDPEWVDLVREACEPDGLRVVPEGPVGGSEDATFMMRRVQERGGKATYMLFGSPTGGGHHHPRFDFREEAMEAGVRVLARTICHVTDGAVR
jgi:aminobenzoyl-glutamate utilization protein A